MTRQSLGYALAGCGQFGRFCLGHYRKMEGIRPVAVYDADADVAAATGRSFDLAAEPTWQGLLRRDDVQIVHLATPPATHASLTIQALEAGKHVLCEKPLAMSTAEAERVVAAVERTGRRVTVNFVLRYSPIVAAVQWILREGILGRPLRAYFENYAQDEVLPPEHWFWNRALSGGIFIEHGVHFFDLYRQWFGEGGVEWATALTRPGTQQQDRVLCAIRFEDMLATHYHGFDQPIRLDRQRHYIVCPRGGITVRGWIPLELEVRGLLDESQQQRLGELVPQGVLSTVQCFGESEQRFVSRGRPHRATTETRLEWIIREPKPQVYGDLIRGVMEDFRDFILHDRQPRVTLLDAVESVRLAEAATEAAERQMP